LPGFDAIINIEHPSFAKALETLMVCEIPYNTLNNLSNSIPKLKKILRIMSIEICEAQEMLTLLNCKNAEQRLATFISTLSIRYHARSLSLSEFRLSMTRNNIGNYIGNYIGLTVEIISCLLNCFHKNGLIAVDGKLITMLSFDKLYTSATL
jgi:CRP/FNR family transcriptional regulator